MNQNRRRPSNAIDGFVPRNRVNRTNSRASLDSQVAKNESEDFVPRQSNASQPLQLSDDNWSDENTLTIDPTETSGGSNTPEGFAPHSRNRKKDKPVRWWQFGRKRRIRKGKPEPSTLKKVVRRIILIVLLIGVLAGGFLGWKVLKNTTKVFNGNILGILNTTKLKGEDQGRVNILLAGNSADDPGHDGANLTDSIMLVSINTKDNSAFMVSIPRDLYVNYGVDDCSVGYRGKINAAYVCGEQVKFSEPDYATGGMGLLEKVVHENFGVKINYYALVNYAALQDAVNAVGGVSVTIKSNDPRGIYDPSLDYTSRRCCSLAKYPNGTVKLDGKQALNLARARGDSAGSYGFAAGDFTRTEHQRQMLVALKDKALSAGVLSNPAKISSLLDSIGGNVKTDFKTSEIHRLYDVGKKVQSSSIQSIGLTDDNVSLVTTGMINGQSVVIPTAGASNFAQLKAFMLKLTSSDPIVREGAKVTVLNASGVVGLAQTKASILTAKGLMVSAVGNAPSQDVTTVIDLTAGKKASTKAYLKQQFGVTPTTDTVANPIAKNYQTDFVIILGKQSTVATPAAN